MEKATEKQVSYLRHLVELATRLGISVDGSNLETMSKRVACDLIDYLVKATKRPISKPNKQRERFEHKQPPKKKSHANKPLVTYLGEGRIKRFFDLTAEDGGEAEAKRRGLEWVGAAAIDVMSPPCWDRSLIGDEVF